MPTAPVWRRFAVLPTALALVAAILLAAACDDPPTGPTGAVDEITSLPRQLSANEVAVVAASNRFSFELLKKASQPDENLFLSPLSASMALGMTMNGAAGDTWAQMRAALGFGALSQEEINATYRSLIDLLLDLDRSVETAIGNSVWWRTGFPVQPTFVEAVQAAFDAEAAELDFSDPGASTRINTWVDDATRGKITEIVPGSIPSEVMMYLINAIYFKGTWTFQFDPADTRNEAFHLADGTTRKVPLMALQGTLPYRSADSYQAVDLPYGGKAFSMTILLPRQGVTPNDLIGSLDADAWADLSEGFGEAEVKLYLPRFRMRYERTLNDDLKALGMTDAFDDRRADFSRLSPVPGLFLSKVLQKAFVDVNEEGTEAAAVTVVEVSLTSAGSPPVVRVDRPFLFVLRERLSGTILFVGKIVTPPQA